MKARWPTKQLQFKRLPTDINLQNTHKINN